jgi:hypothetical protein
MPTFVWDRLGAAPGLRVDGSPTNSSELQAEVCTTSTAGSNPALALSF